MASIGERLGTSQTQDFVLLGALAVGFYVIVQLVQGLKLAGHAVGVAGQAVATAYTSTVDALSSGLYSLFGPDDAKALGAMDYLIVAFPDGQKHAVPANTVTSTGLFQWTGFPAGSQTAQPLQLVKDSSGAWYATDDTDFGVTNPAQW